MAYFLKKSTLKGRTYLSICESFYNHNKKGTSHKTFKSLGSVETHLANGIDDPISHFQKEVDELNFSRQEEGIRKISDVSPLQHLGYFPLRIILEKLNVKKYINYFHLTNEFKYDLFELIST